MKTIYESPQSKSVRVSTILAFLFILVALILEIFYFTDMGRSMEAIILTSVLLLVAFSSFLVFPLYIISDDESECSVCGKRFRGQSSVCPFCGARFAGSREDDEEFDKVADFFDDQFSDIDYDN